MRTYNHQGTPIKDAVIQFQGYELTLVKGIEISLNVVTIDEAPVLVDKTTQEPEKDKIDYRTWQDFSSHVRDLKMYSFDRPSNVLWDAVMNGLIQGGFSKEAAEQWLKSKYPRWSLDGSLGETISKIGFNYGIEVSKEEKTKADCESWALK